MLLTIYGINIELSMFTTSIGLSVSRSVSTFLLSLKFIVLSKFNGKKAYVPAVVTTGRVAILAHIQVLSRLAFNIE